jgi:hypothetical protein
LPGISIDDAQRSQLVENLKKAQRDLKETVWRTYKNIMLLDKDNQVRTLDMGLVHSSAAESLVQFLLNHLRKGDEIQSGISPKFLERNWSPAFKEWSTRAVRDAFYASPVFPRLSNPEAIKETIARGVRDGILAYVGKGVDGKYRPFMFECGLDATDVEISDETFIVTGETALAYREGQAKPPAPQPPTLEENPRPATASPQAPAQPGQTDGEGRLLLDPGTVPSLSWIGEIPPQKWMNFYTRVLSKFVAGSGLKLTVKVEVIRDDGISKQNVEETRAALRELGLNDKI